MKKILLFPLVFALLLVISCSKSDTSDPSADLVTKSAIISTGNWKVTQFLDSGKDETTDFSALSFSFNSDGTLIAKNSTNSYTGSWVLTQSSSASDDDPSVNDLADKITIIISGDKLMDKLSKKWAVSQVSSSLISLTDDNLTSLEALKFGR
jgi:hypothetical protein